MPTWTGLGANNNWNTVGNWDTAVPTSTTTAVFNGSGVSGSKDCTITAGATCVSINTTGYTGQLNFANQLTVAGSVTWGAGMQPITGSGNLNIQGTSTYTSNGIIFPNNVEIGQVTVTLGDNSTVQRLSLTTGLGANLNNNTLFVLGNFTQGFYPLGGTATINLIGSGNFASSAGAISTNLIISGTYTLSGTIVFGTRTLTADPNSVITDSNSTLRLSSCTWVSNGKSWGNLELNGGTVSMTGSAIVKNLRQAGLGSAINSTSTVYVTGDLTHTFYALQGTANIELTGSNNITWNGTGGGSITNNLTINKTGIISLSGVIYGGATSTLTHISGTINPGSSSFTSNVGTVYDIRNIGFNLFNWSPTAGASHTIRSGSINVTNNLTLAGNTTFAGTGGWTAANLRDSTAGRVITLATGSTYTVTSNLLLAGTNASPFQLVSNVASTPAFFNLTPGATQTVSFVTARDINSAGGQSIWDWLGTGATLTRTVNWNPYVSASYLVPFTTAVGFSN